MTNRQSCSQEKWDSQIYPTSRRNSWEKTVNKLHESLNIYFGWQGENGVRSPCGSNLLTKKSGKMYEFVLIQDENTLEIA